ncbi:MAG: DJ-1/PfpI family protein [Candidatus Omnitrophica bacterium]|nr:DJ-1/PfpI family protein [Candidatus Omnitrophota bacterium]MBU1127692.1 DJ-1/PfpI family protein [Candidatus Omnitrophota bacterium]MBU1784231.1 DJ-1/PfpI family protein [Candidatus Omnitrophota bacterium]MBU1851924.1 DJ-1/PfpI family protein [Candidatus Omnitrophota bacterium]
MSKKAIVVLAEGFEEIEAITPIDILRRAGVDVIVVGLEAISIRGAHDVIVNADARLDDIDFMPDAIVFPGGSLGAKNLARSNKLKDLIIVMNAEGRLIAAICAAPALLLAPLGILDGKQATCYPSMEEEFSAFVQPVDEQVVQDENIITSKGPGTSAAFALRIAEDLLGTEKAEAVRRAMLLP